MFAPEPLAVILAPPKLVLSRAQRCFFATPPFIALLVRQASRLVLITELAVLIIARQAFLFGSATLFVILSSQLVLSLALLIKPATIRCLLILSLQIRATLRFRLALLIKPTPIHFLLISSLLVSTASLLFCLSPLLVIVLTLLVNPAPLFLGLTLLVQLTTLLGTLLLLSLPFAVAALLVVGLSSLLFLRLSFAIAALIFGLAALLVLRLPIRVAALFLRLPFLLLCLLIVLSLPLSLILVVALLPLFAVLCPLTPTALSIYLPHCAQQGHDAENEQKGKSINVINFHDYLHRERG